jgi:hypothetical protein
MFVLAKHEHLSLGRHGIHEGVVAHAGGIEVGDDAAIRELYCLPDDLANWSSGELHASVERCPGFHGDQGLYNNPGLILITLLPHRRCSRHE